MQNDAMKAGSPIPLVVIGGYLGAGKTTLLNAMLTQGGEEKPRKIAVLVNDFGDVNIDAALIRERTDDVINLENGCICCSIGGRLVDALVKISERPERPEWLVIEASGVSDPVKIAQIGLLDRAFRLFGIVVAVDAERVDETLADAYVGDIARRQIEGATALVLTKVDLVTPERKSAAHATLTAINATAVPFESDGARPLSLDAIFDLTNTIALPKRGAPALRANGPLAGFHHDVSSFSWRSDVRLDRKRLKAAFQSLGVKLLRAKGIVWLEGANVANVAHELHVVGSRVLIAPLLETSTGAAPRESTIVLIGRFAGEEERGIQQRLDSTRVPG